MQQDRLTDEGKAVGADGTIASNEPAMGSDRSFGFVFTIVFAMIGLFPLLDGRSPRAWSLAVAGALLVLTLVKAEWLAPFNTVWFRFGLLLHRIVNPIVLAVIYFSVSQIIQIETPVDHSLQEADVWGFLPGKLVESQERRVFLPAARSRLPTDRAGGCAEPTLPT